MHPKINLKRRTKRNINKNTKKNTKNNTRKLKLNKFGGFLLTYSGILITIVIVLLLLLYGTLKDYEKSMPNNTMRTIVKEFTPDNIEQILIDNSVKTNDFETVSLIADYFKLKMQDNEVIYKRKSGEFTNETPVYLIKAGDATIAKVTLVENGKNTHKFTKWKLGSISFDGFIEAENEITITAPSVAEVKINGVKITDSYIIQKDIKFDIVKNIDTFINVPTNVMYKVNALMTPPKITASLNGLELEVAVDGKTGTVKYPADTTLFEAQKPTIHTINQEIGKYIINRGSLTTLNKYLIGNAKNILNNIDGLWAYLYGKTYTYEFKTENISNMIKYSDNCFSCCISYDLYVKWNDGDITYPADMTYTFVKTNGSWLVADIILN